MGITLVEAGGAGAEHHGDAIAAILRDGFIHPGLDLRERGQQQLIVARTVSGKVIGDGGQFAVNTA